MTNALRIGIVGAHPAHGWGLTSHLPAIRSLKRLAVTAVAARTRDIAEEAAKVYGAKHAFTDAVSLSRCTDVDVVVVCVRVPLHREVVLAAVDAGKHVYCEWPLGRSLNEAQELRDAAKRSGIRHVIGLQGRTNPAIDAAAKLVKSGRIGRVLSARMVSTSNGWGAQVLQRYAYTADASTGATLLTITAGHSLDSLRHVLGGIETVSALLATQRTQVTVADSGSTLEPTSPDTAVLCVRHDSGCVSSIAIGGGRPRFGGFVFDITGESGELRISGNDLGDFQVIPLTLTGHLSDEDLHVYSETDPTIPSGTAANVARVYQRLINDIDQGSETAPNFDDAVSLSGILEAVQRSSDNGQIACIPT